MRATLICLHYPPEPTRNAPYSGALTEGLAERGVRVHVVTCLPHYPQWRINEGYGNGGTELRNGVAVTRRRRPVPERGTPHDPRPGTTKRALCSPTASKSTTRVHIVYPPLREQIC
jgi:hypothetical protein